MSSKATTYIRDKHEADILDGAKNLSTFVKEHDVPHCRGKLCPARLKPTYSLFLNNERISLMERILYEADSGTLPISRHAYDQFHVGMSRHAKLRCIATSEGSTPPEDSYTKHDFRDSDFEKFCEFRKKYPIIGPFGTVPNKSTILDKSQKVNYRPSRNKRDFLAKFQIFLSVSRRLFGT